MYILEVNQELIDACGDYGLASILHIIQNVMHIIQIVVPILMVISATFILVTIMMNPEDKKKVKAFFNCIAAGVIVFFLPFIVNLTMTWLDDSFNVTACWNVAEETESMVEWYDQNSTSSNNSKDKKKVKDKESDYHFSE